MRMRSLRSQAFISLRTQTGHSNGVLAPPQNQQTRPQQAEVGSVEVAERTGLEPATSGVTGRRSNQLNYRSW